MSNETQSRSRKRRERKKKKETCGDKFEMKNSHDADEDEDSYGEGPDELEDNSGPDRCGSSVGTLSTIVFFVLLGGLVFLTAMIFLELRGSDEVGPPIAESRYASILGDFVDERDRRAEPPDDLDNEEHGNDEDAEFAAYREGNYQGDDGDDLVSSQTIPNLYEERFDEPDGEERKTDRAAGGVDESGRRIFGNLSITEGSTFEPQHGGVDERQPSEDDQELINVEGALPELVDEKAVMPQSGAGEGTNGARKDSSLGEQGISEEGDEATETPQMEDESDDCGHRQELDAADAQLENDPSLF